MADMAPDQPQRDPTSYLQYSQGWRDGSGEALFSGIGDTIKMGVAAIDEGYKRLIKDDARQQVDDIQNVYGGRHDLPTLRPETKDEIDRFANRMRTYKQAMLMGNAKESTYWGALDASARQLRARYPGYRDHIDDVMKEFTGQNPANALLRETRQEMEAMIKKAEDPIKRYRSLVDEMRKEGSLPADYDPATLNYGYEKLFAISSEWNRKEAGVKARQAQVTLATAEGKFDQEEAGKLAKTQWGIEVQKKLFASGTLFSKSTEEIERIRQSVGNRIPTAQESAQMTALAEQQIQELDRFEQSFLLDTNRGLGGKSYGVALTKEQRQDIREFTDNLKADIRSSVTSKELGFVHRATRMAELWADGEKQAALGEPSLRELNGMRSILGESGMAAYLSMNPGKLKAIDSAYRDLATARMANPSQQTSLREQFVKLQQAGANKPEVLSTVIDDQVNLLTNPNTPHANRMAIARSLYGPDNATFLQLINSDPKTRGTTDQTHRVFNKLANSGIAKRLHDISVETGDAGVWNMYKDWVVSQTYSLNAVDINTISRAQATAPGVNIRFNPQEMAFQVERTPENVPGIARPGETPGMAIVRGALTKYDTQWENKTLTDTISRVNLSLQPLRDIASYDKVNKTDFALAVLSAMAARKESVDGRRSVQESILSKLAEVVYKSPEGPYWKKGNPAGYDPEKGGPAIDLTPGWMKSLQDAELPQGQGFVSPFTRRLNQAGDWLKSFVPSREETDKQRNRVRGQQGPIGTP